jgi:hypothetical protein
LRQREVALNVSAGLPAAQQSAAEAAKIAAAVKEKALVLTQTNQIHAPLKKWPRQQCDDRSLSPLSAASETLRKAA